ncbi:MAG: long-chain fatty acid--CoA ligase [Acidimicrobiia bacterium]
MQSTMQDFPLTVGMIFRHGRTVHRDSEVVTFEGHKSRRATFAEVADRAQLLAAALRRLKVDVGDRVGTLAWNHQEHLEAYFAIPGIGAVLHTLNLRLFPDQLRYIINHAEDKAIIVDDSLIPLLAPMVAKLSTVEHYVVIGDGDISELTNAVADTSATVHRYGELLAAESPGYQWPEIDEYAAAAMCYTSGTTGNPKGVVYSHRSTVLHSMGVGLPAGTGFTDADRVLTIVPMFHANAWGFPYAAWFSGSDLLFPGPFLQCEPLARFIEDERPTRSAAVPTIWNDLLHHAESHHVDLSSLVQVTSGGAATPRSLIEAYQRKFGIKVVQGWGMTEISPLAAMSWAPKGTEPASDDDLDWRASSGRVLPGVELRIVDDDGTVMPWDGESVGEIQVRGPWVTGSYYRDPSPEKFSDGWLRTGDIASVTPNGFVRISDRAKDVIKSGGEWISSVELEGHLMAHDDVAEAAVIAVPDERWSERPLACVVLKADATTSAPELRDFLRDRVPAWQLPERWTFIEAVPKTSVGKFDKKVLRAQHADELLIVEEIE